VTGVRAGPLLSLVLLLSALRPGLAEDDAAIEGRRRDLANIEGQVQTLQQDLGERRARRDALRAELDRHERDVADLARARHQLAAMIENQERSLRGLQAELDAQHETLAGGRAALGALLRSAYAMGRGQGIRLLLDQQDLQRVSRVLAYYGYLNRYQLDRIEAVAAAVRRLAALTAEAAEESQRLAQLAERQAATERNLKAAQAERAAVLAELERVIAGSEEQVAELQADAEGLRRLVEQLERQAQALPEAQIAFAPISERRGQLPWPIAGQRVLARFGAAKGAEAQRWDGLVIAAPEGSEVRAVHPGRVVYADWLRGFGLLLIIEHEDGYMTLYGHNQTLLKEPGEWVAAGDAVALSGTSGGQRAAGLYFAIRQKGRAVDPERWFTPAGRPLGRADRPAPARAREQVVVLPIQPVDEVACPRAARAAVPVRPAVQSTGDHTLCSNV
jgi:septal ring factor EnvC (AmiA/AmiB activator)